MNDEAAKEKQAKQILSRALDEIAALGLSPELTYMYESLGGQRSRHWQTIDIEHVSFTDGDLAKRDQYRSNLEKSEVDLAASRAECERLISLLSRCRGVIKPLHKLYLLSAHSDGDAYERKASPLSDEVRSIVAEIDRLLTNEKGA